MTTQDLARALCSDYPEDYDALSPAAQAYWLRMAARAERALLASDIALDRLEDAA